MTHGRGLLATLLLPLVLVACGASVPTPEPTLPPRPAVPHLWRTVASDGGDVQLVVPTDLNVTDTRAAIVGSRDEVLIVSAIGPGSLEQPRAGESVADWIERLGFLAGDEANAELGAVTRRELLLPDGPALEVSAGRTTEAGEAWTMVHVFDTGRGLAVLAFSGQGSAPDQPTDEMRIMRELVDFAP